MKRRAAGILCLLLAVLMLCGCAVQHETKYFAQRDYGTTRYENMRYERYDRTRMDALIAELRTLSASGKADKAMLGVYDKIVEEAEKAATLNSLIAIRYSQNPNDEEINSEKNAMLEILISVSDDAYKAIRDALLSPAGAELREHLETDEVREFIEYKDLSEREKEIAANEEELQTEYERLMLNFDVSVEVEGEIWTMDKLEEQLDKIDGARVTQIYSEIEKKVNLLAGGIMQELVALRLEKAKLAGYDSYVDYEYKEVYTRDFTKEEAAEFSEAVKTQVGPKYFSELRSDTALSVESVECKITAANVDYYIGKYAKKISSEIYDSYSYMKKYNLCDLTSDKEKMDQGYTTELYSYDSPFIYNMCYENDAQTLADSVHEFGHFTAMHYMPTQNVLTDSVSYDIAEVHSQGLELLYDAYYDEIFKKDAPMIRARHLFRLITSVVEGCIQDEFQQYLYTHPDMSVEEMNKAYCKIRAAYGDEPETGVDTNYNWMYIMHTFSSPMYYISYATSALTALDIWTRAQTDRQAAIDKYLYFTSFGMNDYGYLELLDICDMGNFRDAEYINTTCGKVVDAIETLKTQAA